MRAVTVQVPSNRAGDEPDEVSPTTLLNMNCESKPFVLRQVLREWDLTRDDEAGQMAEVAHRRSFVLNMSWLRIGL